MAALGCGAPGQKPAESASDADKPPLVAIVREGDPAPVLGLFVDTEGLAGEDSAAVALAGVLEARLSALDARVEAQHDGVRANLVFEGAATVDAVRHALLDPVGASDPAHAVVRRKLDALARMPVQDDPCSGRVSPSTKNVDSVEAVRASIGLGRVALAVVGGLKAADAARAALRAGKRWPKASAFPSSAEKQRSPGAQFVEGKPRVIARANVAAASSAARSLGARFSTEMTLSGSDACLRIDTAADPAAIASAKRAIVDALDAAKDASFDAESTRAVREADGARDAAERAAAWALARVRASAHPPVVTVIGPAGLEGALARAEADLASPVLEARTRTEPGQGSVWVLVASPCGTESEGVTDAGVSALFATAAAFSDTVAIEPWIAPDGIGLLAHAVRPTSDARVGEMVARALFDVDITPSLPKARTALLGATQPGLAVLGAALAPGHPSWIVPTGTPDALLRMADATVMARAASLRAGPWRAAILSDDASMPATAVIDRHIPRGGPGSRSCPTAAPRTAATPGMYAAVSASSNAYLAFPLEDATLVPWLISALGDDLLAKTLSGTVRSASAHVVGAPRAPTLAVFLDAPDSALDAAVLQARSLFDRLRKTGFTTEEATRARAARTRIDRDAHFDARRRVVDLWRGAKADAAPNDAALNQAASNVFKDEALVVVAARPRRDK